MMKVVVITGVNTGLGEAFFNYFVKKSEFKIIAISRKLNINQQELLVQKRFIHIQLDFQNLNDSKEQLNLQRFIYKNDSVIFINNAATIQPIKPIGKFTDLDIMKSITINTISPLILINHIVSIDTNELKIINISSGAAKHPIIGWSLYCAVKSANEMFVDVLNKQEESNESLSVFNIDPGVLDSNMQSLIRDTDATVFPRLEDFRKLKENNTLKQPQDAVIEILNKCNLA